MNHITDFQLNEYLDNVLGISERGKVDAHLRSCKECSARFEELRLVFTELEHLQEVEPSHDLTSAVMTHLTQPQSRLWTRAFAVQFGAALGTVLFFAAEIAQTIYVPALSDFQLSIPKFRFAILNLPPSIPYLSFHFPKLPALPLSLSNSQIFITIVSTLLLWLIGNVVLLRERSEVQK